MNAAAVLAELRAADVAVSVQDGRLRLGTKPSEPLAPSLLARVRALKPELVALLSAPHQEALPEAPSSPPAAPSPRATYHELSAAIFALPRAAQVEVWAAAARLEEAGVDRLEAERRALAAVTAPDPRGERPALEGRTGGEPPGRGAPLALGSDEPAVELAVELLGAVLLSVRPRRPGSHAVPSPGALIVLL